MIKKISVFGSGSIGTYVGGSLLAAGAEVVLIGRSRMRERLAMHGLHLSDLQQRQTRLTPAQLPYSEMPDALAGAGLILVTVKSSATEAAAQAILQHADPAAVVLSLQNGIGNAATLQDLLPGRTVIGGMVPFNVVQVDDSRLHRGTAGELMIEATPAIAPWLPLFALAHLPLQLRDDFNAVQWGKLLLNLNNAVNALSGLPLKTQLSQRDYRRCLASLISEALRVLRAAAIAPAQVGRVPPQRLPMLLRLPDFLFHRIAAQMLHIDPEARSSMADDLQAGRLTEIEFLNGAVVALAAQVGRSAPINQRIVTLIREAEQGRLGAIDGVSLRKRLRATAR